MKCLPSLLFTRFCLVAFFFFCTYLKQLFCQPCLPSCRVVRGNKRIVGLCAHCRDKVCVQTEVRSHFAPAAFLFLSQTHTHMFCRTMNDPLSPLCVSLRSQNQTYGCGSVSFSQRLRRSAQCPPFSGDGGTQDRRNRAGLQEGRRVRTALTAIGRSCTFSMRGVGGGVTLPIHTRCQEAKTPFRATSQSLFSTVLCYCGIKRLLCTTLTDGQETVDIVDIGKRIKFLSLNVE